MEQPEEKRAIQRTAEKQDQVVEAACGVEDRGGQLPEGQRNQVASAVIPHRWKTYLDSYQELRAVQFPSPEHFATAAKLLWTDELRDLPYDLVGNRTLIVPAEAVPYFRGLAFTETDVLSPDDLAPEELAELRKEQGPY